MSPIILLSQKENLILNGDFESYKKCPDDYAQLNLLESWFEPFTQDSSAELFSTCATRKVGVPSNSMGYQMPRSGNAYIGIIFAILQTDTLSPVDPFIRHYKEYANTKLKQDLEKEKYYQLKFYISLADTSLGAISKTNIQVYFSKDSSLYHGKPFHPLPYHPQVKASDKINDYATKRDWDEVSFIYMAEGGERYLTIGNFSSHIDIKGVVYDYSGRVVYVYYYIDDVSLYEIDNSYSIIVDTLQFLNLCEGRDSVNVQLTNHGDSLLDFTKNPVQLTLALKQGKDTVQLLQDSIVDNRYNPNNLPLSKDSSLWVKFGRLQYEGDFTNYTLSVNAEMAADSFPQDNFLEAPVLSIGQVTAHPSLVDYADSLRLIAKNVYGDAQWQMSINLVDWQNIGFADTLAYAPKECENYYRLSICDLVYSDTLHIQLDKIDLSVVEVEQYSPCADSMRIKIRNTGCSSIDFTKFSLGVVFRMMYDNQLVVHENKMIQDNQNNPEGKPLEAGDSMWVLVKGINNSASGEYITNVQISYYEDMESKNNTLDTLIWRNVAGGVSLSIDTVCYGDTVYLQSEYPYGVWEYSEDRLQWQKLSNSNLMTYRLENKTYFRYFLCGEFSDTLVANVKPRPLPIMQQTFSFCNSGEQLLLLDNTSISSQVYWYTTPNGGTPLHQGFEYLADVKKEDVYYLEIEKDGCYSQERSLVKINLGGCALEIPNVFTPNGDGVNDVFKYGQAYGKDIHTVIYNRWGKKIKEFSGNEGWDGKDSPAGVYYYTITLENEVYKGTVTLIR